MMRKVKVIVLIMCILLCCSCAEKNIPDKNTRLVYITPYGERYHYSIRCAGDNAIARRRNEVCGEYSPCKNCVKDKVL